MATSRHVHQPRQDRSRATLDRIARAAEELLEHRAFNDISVVEIIERAGCSSGSFYARFPGKDALLPYLYERYDADLRPRVQAAMASVDWERLSLRETVDLLVARTIDMYAERRHLMRAIALFARARPHEIDLETRSRRGAVTDMPARLLVRFGSEFAHDDPLTAARIGFFMVAAAAREKVLFAEAPHASDTPLSDDALKAELSRMLFAYLTCR